MARAVDVTKRKKVEAFVEAAVQRFGRLDVFINNAGLMPLSPLAANKVEEWEQMVDVNIKGCPLWYRCGIAPISDPEQRPFD